MASTLFALATVFAAIAGGQADAAPTAPAPAPNEQVYLEKLKQARDSRDRDLKERKQALAARRAEVERDLDAAKKGAIISDFRKRLADGSVMLDDGRTVTLLTERLGAEVRLSFCDQDHKDSYLRQRSAELTTLAAGIERLDAEKNAAVVVRLNLAKLAFGDVGNLDSSGEAVADVIKVIDNSDVLVSLRTSDQTRTTLWISSYATAGIKEKVSIKLTGPFVVVGTRDNPSPPPRTVFEIRPLNLTGAAEPQKR